MITSLIEGQGWLPRSIENVPRTLLKSLWHSRFNRCFDPRDIVYSVLAISTDGRGLNVRYDIDIIRLALDVLLLYKRSLCLCHAKIVLRALKISAHTRNERGRPHSDRPFVEVNASRLSLTSDNTYCSRGHWNIGLSGLDSKCHFDTSYIYCFACKHTDWPSRTCARSNNFSVVSRSHHNSIFGHMVITRAGPIEQTGSEDNLGWRVF
jgi:hypothetical protein